MLLAVDVGNTNLTLGVYHDSQLKNFWRLETSLRKTADEYGILLTQLLAHSGLDPKQVKAVAIGSVVPTIQHTLRVMSQRYLGCEPLFVGTGVRTGMPVLYHNPAEVGADRVINAVAAYQRWPGALIVVDFGTATTFDAVSAKGEYLGGAICPGINSSMDALFRSTAMLPRVEFSMPERAIGRSTVTSMQSGLVFGYVALVDGMCARIAQEMKAEPKIVATGGLASLIAEKSKAISEVEELLTLEGLRIIYERNR